MEIPRHTRAFCQSLIEAGADGPRNLQHTLSVNKPCDEDAGHNAENSEPVRLIPGRGDAEVQGCTPLVPDAIVITRDHLEPVSPRPKVAIESLPPCTWLLPSRSVTFQFVAEVYSLWDGET